MTEWKIRQELYHKLNSDYTDDLNDIDTTYRTDKLLEDIENYVRLPPEEMGWVYPAKSYVVAVCYAHWISEDFDEDFYEVLNDPDLLYNNDPYFVKYEDDKDVYDSFIQTFKLPLPDTGVVPHIRGYYLEELLFKGVLDVR